MNFLIMFKYAQVYLPISIDEKIKSIIPKNFLLIKILCITAIVFYLEKIYFDVISFLESLKPTRYDFEVGFLEKAISKGQYHNEDGMPLTENRLY